MIHPIKLLIGLCYPTEFANRTRLVFLKNQVVRSVLVAILKIGRHRSGPMTKSRCLKSTENTQLANSWNIPRSLSTGDLFEKRLKNVNRLTRRLKILKADVNPFAIKTRRVLIAISKEKKKMMRRRIFYSLLAISQFKGYKEEGSFHLWSTPFSWRVVILLLLDLSYFLLLIFLAS